MARAGPFFILPALALWCAVRLAPAGARWPRRLGYLAGALAAIVLGVAVHAAVLRLTAAGTTFGDYPAIAYGLLHREDFTYLLATHPSLAALDPAARAHEAWRIVLGEAAARPFGALGALAQSFADLFVSRAGLFGFVWRNPDDIVLENGAALRAALAQHGPLGPLYLWIGSLGLYSLFNAVAMAVFAVTFVIAAVVAVVALYRRRGDAYAGMLRYAIAGVLVSAPFTPPWITSSHQVQTATLAFLAAVPAIVLVGRTQRPAPAAGRGLPLAPVAFALALVAAAAVLRLAPSPSPVCPGAKAHAMRLYPTTAVGVAGARTMNLHQRARADLVYSIQFLKRHNREFAEAVVPFLKEGTVYVAAYDACDGGARILIDDRRVLDLENRDWQYVEAGPLAEPRVMHVEAVRGSPAR